ncbi:uncharacterized protein DUF4440 [Chitinophaga skermanii]|uniref:Uncharacterized protein DUF4440 n=2 Tax=Chitinophaga skermanii TaxID=331697 RepID=A0A327QCB2_9BACT|nr:uncharacterized protein DUF4440 [Chitinophaga skermanii]
MRFFSILLTMVVFVGLSSAKAQNNDEQQIRNILKAQNEAWNTGNLESFMEPYWHSDSLMFIGKSGVTYGWQATLDNYKRGYPDKTAMGKLTFTFIQFKPISKDTYFVVGKWHLARTIGDLEGHYTLLWKKIKGKWNIVADHSS